MGVLISIIHNIGVLSHVVKQMSMLSYKKRCTRLTAASDKVYQLLAHGRRFSLASSTTKTGRHDIAEILLKLISLMLLLIVAVFNLPRRSLRFLKKNVCLFPNLNKRHNSAIVV
jgi:hypothetical protein